jgi:hypothetical protein
LQSASTTEAAVSTTTTTTTRIQQVEIWYHKARILAHMNDLFAITGCKQSIRDLWHKLSESLIEEFDPIQHGAFKAYVERHAYNPCNPF